MSKNREAKRAKNERERSLLALRAQEWNAKEYLVEMASARLDGFPKQRLAEFAALGEVSRFTKRKIFAAWMQRWNDPTNAWRKREDAFFPPQDWLAWASLRNFDSGFGNLSEFATMFYKQIAGMHPIQRTIDALYVTQVAPKLYTQTKEPT